MPKARKQKRAYNRKMPEVAAVEAGPIAPSEAPPKARSRSRMDEMRAERRERKGRGEEMTGRGRRLAIPPQFKDDKENEYRWINDDKSRVWDLTNQDYWEKVEADDSEAVGHSVRRQVGTKKNGDALYAHLVRKPKEFCDEDRAAKQERLDATFNQLAGGKRGDTVSLGDGQTGYVAIDTEIHDGRTS